MLGRGLSGLVGSAALPSDIYKNVPLTPAAKFAGRLGTAAVGEGVREAGRDLGVKERLPGIQLSPTELQDVQRMRGTP